MRIVSYRYAAFWKKTGSLKFLGLMLCAAFLMWARPGLAANATAICFPSDLPNPCIYGSCCGTSPCCTTSGVEDIAEQVFDDYRTDFIMDSFYTDTWEPDGFTPAADGISSAYAALAVAYGALIDGSIMVDTLLDLQTQQTKTLKKYTPSTEMCRFGTLSRALAASDERVSVNQTALSELMLARSIGTIFSTGASGRGMDNLSRLYNFRDTLNGYCDLGDNNNGLAQICDTATPTPELNHNRDIDYTRTIDANATINLDYTDPIISDDEHNVATLGYMLYGHRLPVKRPTKSEIEESEATRSLYREQRSVYARRAAAQNTYNTIAAMKAAGSGASDTHLKAVLQQLGMSVGDMNFYLTAETSGQAAENASYYAQMEILTKTLYQDPRFYAGLMGSRANVTRASAAMSGLGVMQKRDIFRSTERSELLLALLVEMEARKIQANTDSPKAGP
ncbi:MAG: hypothetical protein WC043_10065 [Pseudobdellovibrionaceae bacterium]